MERTHIAATPAPRCRSATTSDPRYAALSRVVGVTVNSEAKAYPFEEIESLGVVNDMVGGEPIVVFWGGGTLDALDSDTVSSGRAIGTGVAYLTAVGDQTLSFSKIGDTWTDSEDRFCLDASRCGDRRAAHRSTTHDRCAPQRVLVRMGCVLPR